MTNSETLERALLDVQACERCVKAHVEEKPMMPKRILINAKAVTWAYLCVECRRKLLAAIGEEAAKIADGASNDSWDAHLCAEALKKAFGVAPEAENPTP